MRGDRLSAPGRFSPLTADHPAVRDGQRCAVCGQPMLAGEVPALIEIGPADAEEARRAEAGAAYTAEADIAHDECVP
jgi:hypothetical protein